MTRFEAIECVDKLQKDFKGHRFGATDPFYERKRAFTTALGRLHLWEHYPCREHAAAAIDKGMSPDHVVALAMLAFTE